MQIAYAYGTRQRLRKENQDSFGVFEIRGNILALVCDGMGGHVGGAQASALAVRSIHDALTSAPANAAPADALRIAVEQANQAIYEAARKNYRLMGMGTTVVATWIVDGVAHIAHVGDSRAYLVRTDEVVLLTRDHTMVNLFVDAELLSPEDAATHPEAHVLSRSLGIERQVEVELHDPLPLADGDRLVLCSDGVHGVVDDDELGWLDFRDPNKGIDEAMRLVEERDGDDNATAIVVVSGEVVASAIPTTLPDMAELEQAARSVSMVEEVQPVALSGPAPSRAPQIDLQPIAAPPAPPEFDATAVDDEEEEATADSEAGPIQPIAPKPAAARPAGGRRRGLTLVLAAAAMLAAVMVGSRFVGDRAARTDATDPVDTRIAEAPPAAEPPVEAAVQTPPPAEPPPPAETPPAEPVATPAPVPSASPAEHGGEPDAPMMPPVEAPEPPTEDAVAVVEPPAEEPPVAEEPPAEEVVAPPAEEAVAVVAPPPAEAPAVEEAPKLPEPVAITEEARAEVDDVRPAAVRTVVVEAAPAELVPTHLDPFFDTRRRCLDCNGDFAVFTRVLESSEPDAPEPTLAFFAPHIPAPPARSPHRPTTYNKPTPRGPEQWEAVQHARNGACGEALQAVDKAMKKSEDYASLYMQVWYCFNQGHQEPLVHAHPETAQQFMALLPHFEGRLSTADAEGEPISSWSQAPTDGIEYRISAWLSTRGDNHFAQVMSDLIGEATIADHLGTDVLLEAYAAASLSRLEAPTERQQDAWARRVYFARSTMNGPLGDLIRRHRTDLAQLIETLLDEAGGGSAFASAQEIDEEALPVPAVVARAMGVASGNEVLASVGTGSGSSGSRSSSSGSRTASSTPRTPPKPKDPPPEATEPVDPDLQQVIIYRQKKAEPQRFE